MSALSHDEVSRFEAICPAEFRDGFKCGFFGKHDGPREPGGYPIGFHRWPLVNRNAWFAGANRGLVERAAHKGGARE